MPTIFIRKKPFFTRDELFRLANIFDNVGQIFLGVVVLSPLVGVIFSQIDRANFSVIVFGLGAALCCWIISMWLTRKAAQL